MPAQQSRGILTYIVNDRAIHRGCNSGGAYSEEYIAYALPSWNDRFANVIFQGRFVPRAGRSDRMSPDRAVQCGERDWFLRRRFEEEDDESSISSCGAVCSAGDGTVPGTRANSGGANASRQCRSLCE